MNGGGTHTAIPMAGRNQLASAFQKTRDSTVDIYKAGS